MRNRRPAFGSGAMAVAIALGAVGWLGLAALSWSSTLPGPICGGAIASISELRAELVPVWSTMVLAMMGPVLAGPLYHLWHRSLARHRVRAIALFLAAYIAVWCGVCLLFAAILGAAGANGFDGTAILLVATALAAVWQFAPAKRSGLLRCHLRPPLAVFGARAWLDPFAFGVRLACWCVVSCWSLMLVCLAVKTNGVWPTLAGSAIIGYERLFSARALPFGRDWRIWLSRAQSLMPEPSLERPRERIS